MDATKLNSKGVGYNQAYMVDVGGQWSTDSKMYTSYPVPVISSVVAPRLDTAGGETVTITGLHFGPVHSNNLIVGTYVNPTLSDYAGSTFNASNCYVSVGHTEITCTSVEGVGYDQVWDVDVGNQLSADSSDTTSYHRPQVHSLEQLSGYSAVTELKTNGSDYIIVNGSYFGPANPSNGLTNVVGYYYNNTLLSHLAGKEYSGDCVVVSQTVMHCATSAGVGYDHEWRVVVGEQTGPSSTVTSSYHVPVIEGLYQYQSYNNLDELNTDGRDEILIKGMYFGPADGTYTGFTNDVNGYYNNSELSDLAGMLYSTNCTVLNDTFMECGVQTGVGHDHQWQIVVGEQPSEYSRDNTSYIIPSIKNITTSGHDITSLLTSGGESITLTGTNFGPVSPFNGELNPISAVYERFSSDLILGLAADQFQALSCSVIIAHIQITCTSAIGVGELHYWTVTVGDQSNMPTNDLVYTSYEPPEIVGFGFQNVLDLTLGSTESTTILIHGTNFGPVDSTNYVNASYSNSDLKG